jgi:hypothetical protein
MIFSRFLSQFIALLIMGLSLLLQSVEAQPVCNSYWIRGIADGSIFSTMRQTYLGYSYEGACNTWFANTSTKTYTDIYPEWNKIITPTSSQVTIGPSPIGDGTLEPICEIYGTTVFPNNPNIPPSNGVIGRDSIHTCAGSSNQKIILSGPNETRPANTGGASSVTITATVTSGGQPKTGVAVEFSVDVVPNSGGHEHHDTNRPKGQLSGTVGITPANGQVTVVFKAPEVAGIHKIKATCTGCVSEAVHEIKVKVADLVPINPNPPLTTDGKYRYALTSVDAIHQGTARYHTGQYWLSPEARSNLQTLIEAFNEKGWGTVALNDASLIWGGRYDISGNWTKPHAEHREGNEIDISFTRANNPISVQKQDTFYKEFCGKQAVEIPVSVLHHFVKQPHFHVYLLKQKACAKTEF